MKPPTDPVRHAARLARKLQMDAEIGVTPPVAEHHETLATAFEAIAAGREMVAARE